MAKGKGVALVDDADFEKYGHLRWCVGSSGYAHRNTGVKTVLLHRLIMDAHEGEEIDHRDLNKLNCQRSNLRRCSRSENMRNRRLDSDNRSGYKGVYFHKKSGKLMARIRSNGRDKYLGLFLTPEAAAVAYDFAAVEHHGEFAMLNYPEIGRLLGCATVNSARPN